MGPFSRQIFEDRVRTQQPNKSHISWHCVYCDCNNYQSSTSCQSCKSWKCDQCKTLNPNYESLCVQCGESIYHHPTKPNPTDIPSTSKWSCSLCTMLNDDNTTDCAICNNPKPS